MLRDSKKVDLDRYEELVVKATVSKGDFSFDKVPAKIYLPERIYDKPHVILKPSGVDWHKIVKSPASAIHCNILNADNTIQKTIESPEARFWDGSSKYWGDDIYENTYAAELQNLHIIDHRGTGKESTTKIDFWISSNTYLAPPTIVNASYTGEIWHERARKSEFGIKDGIRLLFEKTFRDKIEDNGDLRQWGFLVAHSEIDIPAADVEKLKDRMLPIIDDFLLVASFAARQRACCLGWSAYDKDSHTTFYRGNYVFPDIDSEIDINSVVINIPDFEPFMEVSYPAFLSYENKLALRQALHSAFPDGPRMTIDAKFLSLFAGLETLILDFRRREAHEFILPDEEWDTLKKLLKQTVKESGKQNITSPEQRSSIYSKLDELNRISLREAFELFCEEYSVDLSDLWPMFGARGNVGLVDIRNRLIHGDPLPFELTGALVTAKTHLVYTLERVLARVLQWDVNKTNVAPAFLHTRLHSIESAPSEQAKLSKYVFDF